MKQTSITEEEFLKNFDSSKFTNPSISVDNILFTIREQENENYRKLPKKSLQLLMVRRNEHPYQNMWSLPGTFVQMNETLDDCAIRCLKEKTHLNDIYLEQLYTFGDLNRDPRTRVISCTYMSLMDSTKLNTKAGRNVSSVDFFTVHTENTEPMIKKTKRGNISTFTTTLTLQNHDTTLTASIETKRELVDTRNITTYRIVHSDAIAFDHAKAIVYALDRLKNKVEYTDIAFSLMPSVFTLTDLQKCYEILLNKPLLTANFRRKIAHMVTQTDQMEIGAGHRPSKLFTFNPNWHTDVF